MNSIKKNLLYNILYQVLLVILPLITAPYISRTLGADAIGVYSYTYSIVYYFMIVAMLGISNHGNRSVASVRGNQGKLNVTFTSIYVIQLITHSIAIVIYIIYSGLLLSELRWILLLQIIYLFSGLFDVSWLFFGLEEFKLTVVRNVIIKIGTIVLIFIFVHSPGDLWKYTLIMSIGTLFSQIYLWVYVRKYVIFCKIKGSDIYHHIKPIIILFVPVLAYSVYKVMDKIMLGNMSTFVQVGYYQNAEKIINIPMGIITALGTVMLPRMANMMASGEQAKSKDYIRISIKFVTILTTGIAFGLMGVSDNFAPVFYGNEFLACGPIIFLLSFTVFFIGWANVVRTQYLIPQHKDKIYVTSTMIGALANLAINLLLIPKFAAAGAAIGTIVAEATVFAVQILYIRKELPVLKYLCKDIPVILAGLFMMLSVRFIGLKVVNMGTALIVQVGVGVLIYISLILLYWIATKDELGKLFFLNVWKSSKRKMKE